MSDAQLSLKVQQLRDLIRKAIQTSPFERDGFQWAALPQQYYCEQLDISAATLRRWIARSPFVRQLARIDGKVVALVREGEPGPPTPRHIANTMAKIWRDTIGSPVTPHGYGCLVGLAEVWPDGLQIKLFRMVLREWPLFMTGVGYFIHEHNLKSKKR